MPLSPSWSGRMRTVVAERGEIRAEPGPSSPVPPFAWDACPFAGGWAYSASDAVGLMALEVGFEDKRQAVCAAMHVLRAAGCDCTISFDFSGGDTAKFVRSVHAGNPVRLHAPITEFQMSVFRLLLAIAPGHTRTYGDLAAELGHPRSARAVARALAANRAALVIPCHRVVPAAGGAGGWRWGRHLKELVFEAEAEGGLEKLLSQA